MIFQSSVLCIFILSLLFVFIERKEIQYYECNDDTDNGTDDNSGNHLMFLAFPNQFI